LEEAMKEGNINTNESLSELQILHSRGERFGVSKRNKIITKRKKRKEKEKEKKESSLNSNTGKNVKGKGGFSIYSK
jgi:hypothetical protein